MTNITDRETALSKTIVCFLFDGSLKYTAMTLNAVNSFINTTPGVSVGILTPHNFDASFIIAQISDSSRVVQRTYDSHFSNWNPTQHKLDIQKFSDQFESIFWLDSDAIVYKNLSDILYEFYVSPCKVAFLKDHVCWNPHFLSVWYDWRQKKDPFVPQACFMGFKSDIIPAFFRAWEDTWRQWIEPVPFANFPNPLPAFPGSAFCTEQYALGMVLETDLVKSEDVFVIQRITFPLRGSTQSTDTLRGDSSFNLSSFSMSERDISENEMKLLGMKFSQAATLSSFSNASYGGIVFGGQSSAGLFSGPYLQFSGPAFSGPSWGGSFTPFGGENSYTSIPGWNTSYQGGSFTGSYPFFGSFSTSFAGSSSTSFSTSFSGSFPGSFSGSFSSSFPGSFSLNSSAGSSSFSGSFVGIPTSAPGEFFVPVDNIAGGIVHFYSAFYDQSHKWWEQNKEEVIPQLGDFWEQNTKK